MPPTRCNSDTPLAGLVANGPIRRIARSGYVRLMLGVAVVLAVWLQVLPRIGDQPPVRRWIQTLERRRIDPSAMFYTELETMRETRAQIARVLSRHPDSRRDSITDRSPVQPAPQDPATR